MGFFDFFKNAEAYVNSGLEWIKKGNYGMAIAYWKIAARLGDKDAQGKLRSMGITW
ncbi:MAG: hypothetical protein HQL05_09115 [Nitrospirae bacterium]|uniref:hypothetical protein n=1 Tax=Candidatus Magnetobacterium casense TaxID=1455061 RepID=UPI000B2309B2|nr:hypothetical protein [Candidatus Magnetobacterium casensis]MBF0337981.1 hypothetical protein [Nitrospirota bacterium]